MKAVVCPFCGIPVDVAHETQEACIQALQSEILRTRQILENVTEPLRAPAIGEEEEERQRT